MSAPTVEQQTRAAHSETVRYGIEARGVTKTYGDGAGAVTAVDGVDLLVPAGEFWVLLGPSGCGKTTLLRCLAGLEDPSGGSIAVGGRTCVVEGKSSSADRQVGMVFQNYALWPHMTVAQNIAFPLTNAPRRQRLGRAAIRKRVDELLDLMGLHGLGGRKTNQLSGGQQQRVALARAIAVGNDVVLFDEPLSNIDAKVREQLRAELRSMQRQLGFTALYVTHDQAEAFEMADRIAVMRHGRVVQLAAPHELYERPRTEYVARFVGSSNVLRGMPGPRTAAGTTVKTAIGDLVVAREPEGLGDQVVVASRNHRWWIGGAARPGAVNAWRGRVQDAVFMGWYTDYAVAVDGGVIRVWSEAEPQLGMGSEVWIGVDPQHCVLLSGDD